MLHRHYDARSDCPGSLKILRQLGGGFRRRVLDVWECDACRQTNSPHVARRLRAVWLRLASSGRLDGEH